MRAAPRGGVARLCFRSGSVRNVVRGLRSNGCIMDCIARLVRLRNKRGLMEFCSPSKGLVRMQAPAGCG